MSLLVAKPGILSTIQDLGRSGYRDLGINPNGVMDRAALRIINTVLGNSQGEAALELHFPAGEYVFEKDCSFAIGGADFGARLNGFEIRSWSTIPAAKGDILTFSERRSGSRAYLAVAGGFAVDEWLGSKSTNLTAYVGGFHGRKLATHDRVEFAGPKITRAASAGPSLIRPNSHFPTVRVIAGAEYQTLTAISEQELLRSAFTLTEKVDRMGYRLTGPSLFPLEEKALLSAAVTFGAVQLLPDGQLIVLMADHQTSGGYPRIANVIEADLPLLAQLSPGDGVSFHLVSVAEAERARRDLDRGLKLLQVGIALKH